MNCDNISAVSYIFSKWTCAWLPTLYKIHQNKWPINTFDTVDAITGVVDNNGFAKVTITAGVETYIEKEYIKISSSSDDSYDGVWQILQLHSSTVFTISAAYSATATGSFQRYYNNYTGKARVYTGIRPGHVLTADDPIELVGTMSVKPDTDNDLIIDISSYIRKELSPVNNNLCSAIESANGWMGNDTSLWTSYYISYAEAYDLSDGTTVSTFTSTYTDDMLNPYEINYFYASNSTQPFQHFQGRSSGEFAIGDSDPETAVAKWMTPFDKPTFFVNQEYDLAIIVSYREEDMNGFHVEYVLTEYDEDNIQLFTETVAIDREEEGVYRFAFSEYPFQSSTAKVELYLQKQDATVLTETKTIIINRNCTGKIYLRWLNQEGAWDGFEFQAFADYGINVSERKTVRRNIYNDFDNDFVYGNTQDDFYETEAYETRTVRTQYLTENQVEKLKWVRLSNKVIEIIESDEAGCTRFKNRTVLVDPGTFTFKRDAERGHKMGFSYRYTDQIQIQGQ